MASIALRVSSIREELQPFTLHAIFQNGERARRLNELRCDGVLKQFVAAKGAPD
jgi:hypothetical protein